MLTLPFHDGDMYGAPSGACWFWYYRGVRGREVVVKCPNGHAFVVFSQGINAKGEMFTTTRVKDAEGNEVGDPVVSPAKLICIHDDCGFEDEITLQGWTHGTKEPGERFMPIPEAEKFKKLERATD